MQDPGLAVVFWTAGFVCCGLSRGSACVTPWLSYSPTIQFVLSTFGYRVYAVSCYISSTLFRCLLWVFLWTHPERDYITSSWAVNSLEKLEKMGIGQRAFVKKPRDRLCATPPGGSRTQRRLVESTVTPCRLILFLSWSSKVAHTSDGNCDVLWKPRKRLGKHNPSGYTRLILPRFIFVWSEGENIN